MLTSLFKPPDLIDTTSDTGIGDVDDLESSLANIDLDNEGETHGNKSDEGGSGSSEVARAIAHYEKVMIWLTITACAKYFYCDAFCWTGISM